MKKIFFPIIFVLGIFSMGCYKTILDTNPNYAVSSSTMWNTDNLTDLGMAGVYETLRLGYSSGGSATSGLVLFDTYAMDRFAYTGQDYYNSNGNSDDGIVNGTATTSSSQFTKTWQYLYEGVSRANDAIYNIPLQSPSLVTKKAKYVAEAKFMRAYFYFRLNQVFSGIPVYLTPTPYNQLNHASKSRDSVWLVIIQDLTDAINEPNLPAKYAAGDPNYGHATKGAAYALRGMVYQYQNKYDLAIADFQSVQSSGFALYSTGNPNTDYKMLFKAANEQSPEMIFSMQNIQQAGGWGGNAGFLCGTRTSYGGNGWDWYSPSNELVDLYENKDGSKFSWDTYIPGYTTMTPAQREVYFIRDGATAAELTAASTRGADVTKYLAVGNEARIAAVYSNRDPRLSQSVITPYSSYLGLSSTAGTTAANYFLRWPYRNSASPTFDLQADKTAYCLYWYRKFVAEGIEYGATGADRSSNPTDFPLIRYVDVLLRWAECLCEKSGVTQPALDLVNLVRTRAGMPSLQIANAALPTFVSSQADLRNRIRNERRIEFPNEGVNYFDEVRWGTWKALKFTQANGAANGPKQIFGTLTGPQYVYSGDQVLTWPVPSSVVQITNGVVAATPGWIY
ncbi:MAG: RagB/SusD family nutrient uptake outer membrane protein [Sediminibacterium sp.]